MTVSLSEDEIDDLLYLARIGEKDEFTSLEGELCKRDGVAAAGLLEAATDAASGNGVLHMAAANGHHGERSPIKYSVLVVCGMLTISV